MSGPIRSTPPSLPGDLVDSDDVARYERLGDEWWDTRGAMGALHKLNPTRVRYLRDLIVRQLAPEAPGPGHPARPLAGLRLLDIGCGGGLLCEPLARLGADVMGIDPALASIEVARRHAEAQGLDVAYRAATAEVLVSEGQSYDVVLAMEVVEHVPEPAAFVTAACALVRPGGLLVLSTINRTAKSFVLAIVGAEYVLRWLPRGTHRWNQFMTPEEVAAPARRAGLKIIERTGIVYDPLADVWVTSRHTDVNYMIAARRPARVSAPAA